MDVADAKAFLVLAEELHFGRAAQRLQMGQPPLSRLIQKLERSVGTDLFKRTSRQVELTVAGQTLIEPARELIAASDRALESVKSTLTGQIGTVSLGFAGASSNAEVAALARQLAIKAPRLRFEVQSSQFADDSLKKVLDKSLDFSIGLWEFLPSELDALHLSDDDVLIAVHKNHPLAKHEHISMRELAQDPWINLPGGYNSALQNRFRNLSLNAGFVPRRNQTVPDSWTVMLLVGVGMGASLTLSSVASSVPADDVKFLKINDPTNTPLPLRLVWRRDSLNPVLQTVIDTAVDLFS
ncbi:LysR substrate-binding domain-containing protein [Yaniella flava]|uniref:LysR substrate-binding domain-containing protein n=1 Tax=Yaniella flava TaxID=287930 RepID=A0ABN2U2H8_9MICC